MYIDANKLANVRRDVMKKKRLTDAELQEIKNKTIIKKIKEKVVVTVQSESESEDQ